MVKGSNDSTDGSECLVSDCNYRAGQVLSQQTSGLFKGLVLHKQMQSHIMTTKGSALQNSYKTMILQIISSVTSSTTRMNTTTSTTYSTLAQMGLQHQQQQQQPSGITLHAVTGVSPPGTPPELLPIYLMLTHISTQVSSGNAETIALRQEVQSFNSKVKTVLSEVREQEDLLNTTITKFNQCAGKLELISCATQKHEREIDQLIQKFENLELMLIGTM